MPQDAVVTLEVRDGIGWITITNPPINALSRAVRAGLAQCAAEVEARTDIKGIVLRGAGRCFVAGADITELGKPLTKPYLPDVLALIADSRVPWVAALHGFVLGGGLELALACHGRVAAYGTTLGCPEVNLGIIPGAGGTVRLPRLIPVAKAVHMIASGKPIDADSALSLGLIDKLDQDPDTAAAHLLQKYLHGGAPNDLSLRDPVDVPVDAFWAEQDQALKKRARGQNAPIEALQAVRDATAMPGRDALQVERKRFLRLVASDEAAALRHVFFAERHAGASLKTAKADPADLTKVGVIGGGTMGVGIAAALLLAGSRVILIEQSQDQADVARSRIEEVLNNSAKRGKLDAAALAAVQSALTATDDMDRLSDTKLVIEAVFEDAQVKADVFARLDAVLPSDAILASNTSYLDVDALAATTRDPSRVLGLHFFSPAYVMKLLEVVQGQHCSDRALATARALTRHLGKTAIVSGVCDGFIANRIMAQYRAECERMLEDGAMPWEVDRAMRNYGYAMGVFEVQDLAGLDIAWAMRKRRAADAGGQPATKSIADRLCEAGRFGRKTGAGWYAYGDGNQQIDPWVEKAIKDHRKDKGQKAHSFTEAEIMQRILSAMQDEGAKVLEEGIAQSESDIDVAMILGHGFPRHRGGPMFARQKVIS